MTGYQKIISDATGETDSNRIEQIEEWMRDVVFHSTLDWQTKAQLEEGARQAVEILNVEGWL